LSTKFVVAGREEEVCRTISAGAAQAFHGSAAVPAWGGSLSSRQIRDVMACIATFRTQTH
jgi:hypothetical protein